VKPQGHSKHLQHQAHTSQVARVSKLQLPTQHDPQMTDQYINA
jgi:hypothetical protein